MASKPRRKSAVTRVDGPARTVAEGRTLPSPSRSPRRRGAGASAVPHESRRDAPVGREPSTEDSLDAPFSARRTWNDRAG